LGLGRARAYHFAVSNIISNHHYLRRGAFFNIYKFCRENWLSKERRGASILSAAGNYTKIDPAEPLMKK